MKEAKEHFFDKLFLDKLDNNPYLLCFTNGIIDFEKKEFRMTKPDDYVSLCTNIEYIEIDEENVKHMGIKKEITDFMYIPRDTDFFITCISKEGGQFAIPKSKCDKKLSPRYGSVDNVKIELRGAGQASRQINNFMAPGVWDHADKLCAVEVLTPSGNWSSYPPHKHDEESDGAINEEIYYFKCKSDNLYRLFFVFSDNLYNLLFLT